MQGWDSLDDAALESWMDEAEYDPYIVSAIEPQEPQVNMSLSMWEGTLRDVRRTRRFAMGLSWALAGMTLAAFLGWIR